MQRQQPWFVGVALRALAANVSCTSKVFTAQDVVTWSDGFGGKPGMARQAMQLLQNHGMAVQAQPVPGAPLITSVKTEQRWLLTAKGMGTCRAVAQAQPGATPPDPNALSTRLWTLLRARKALTSEDAAATLIDAGARNFSSAQRQIGGYLRAWARLVPHAVKVSPLRAGGCLRYVMVKDVGSHPPPTKATGIAPQPVPAAKARASTNPQTSE